MILNFVHEIDSIHFGKRIWLSILRKVEKVRNVRSTFCNDVTIVIKWSSSDPYDMHEKV